MGYPLMVALFWVAFLPSAMRWQQAVAEEGAEFRSTACMASLVGWKGGPFTITVCRRHNQTDCCGARRGCSGACETGEVLQRRV